MGKKMHRGKQQIMFHYLPGRSFDFESSATIARVQSIRGVRYTDLNTSMLLSKISEEVLSWSPEYRPALREDVLSDASRFVLLEPRGVQAELFPRVFWCQNKSCGRVFELSNSDLPPEVTCPVCGRGRLIQLRFVKVHRCGAIDPLVPYCRTCQSSNNIALDTRGSERISNFRWICRSCGRTTSVFAGPCRHCAWPDTNLRNMDIEVHRASRTFYPQHVVLLNQPKHTSEMDAFLGLREWPLLVGSVFTELPEVEGKGLFDFTPTPATSPATDDNGLSGEDLDRLMAMQASGEISAAQFVAELQSLRERRNQERQTVSSSSVAQSLIDKSGVPEDVWIRAGQDLLEVTMSLQPDKIKELMPLPNDQTPPENQSGVQSAEQLGLSRLTLVSDFPITNATYGYSRADYRPNQCRLNPFPPDQEYRGKFPIYIDLIQADVLMLRLNPERVFRWLRANGYSPTLPNGTDPLIALRGYYVQLFDDISLRETIHSDNAIARMVFGLLHTLCHLSIRQAALLCGLDRTSMAEYVLPRALSFAVYCNHRFGATIGALVSLFEQSLPEWLNAIRENRRCVYDPACVDHGGSCHACTHLAETSCRFFNLNLGRAFLFGGYDPELGNIQVGYLDTSI